MEQLTFQSAALGISLVGGVHDLLTRRIPNWLTFPAVAGGIALQAYANGWHGALDGLAGVALGFAAFFPIYLTGNMGAGDVKLQMAVGAWLGWLLALYVALGAVLVGGTYALFEVVFRGRLKPVFLNGWSFLRALLVPNLVPEKLRVDPSRKFAFGACIALALLLVIALGQAGRLPR